MKKVLIGFIVTVLLCCTATGCGTVTFFAEQLEAFGKKNTATDGENYNSDETHPDSTANSKESESQSTSIEPHNDTPAAAFPATGYVTCDVLTVRDSIPDMFDLEVNKPIGSLTFGERVTVKGYQHNPYSASGGSDGFWYEIDWKGKTAFVAKNFISFAPPDFCSAEFEVIDGQVVKTDAKTKKKTVLYKPATEYYKLGVGALAVWNNRIYFDNGIGLSWVTDDGKQNGTLESSGCDLFAWDDTYLYSMSTANYQRFYRTDKSGRGENMGLPFHKDDFDNYRGIMVINEVIYILVIYEDAETASGRGAHLYSARWNEEWKDLGEIFLGC